MDNELTDALTCLARVKSTADRFSAAAAEYLELMTSEPRSRPVVGGFFITFNGSLVHVARRRTACTCPVCVLQRQGGGTLQLGPFRFGVPAESSEACAQVEAPAEYVVCVLKGGHAVEGHAGAGPGDNYQVRHDGLAITPPLPENAPVLAPLHLGLAGLSLRRPAVLESRGGEIHWS